jgi:hypothetical protein
MGLEFQATLDEVANIHYLLEHTGAQDRTELYGNAIELYEDLMQVYKQGGSIGFLHDGEAIAVDIGKFFMRNGGRKGLVTESLSIDTIDCVATLHAIRSATGVQSTDEILHNIMGVYRYVFEVYKDNGDIAVYTEDDELQQTINRYELVRLSEKSTLPPRFFIE